MTGSKPWRKGDPISAARLNAEQRAAEVKVGGPLQVHQTGSGEQLILAPPIRGARATFAARIDFSQPARKANGAEVLNRWAYHWTEMRMSETAWPATPVWEPRGGANQEARTNFDMNYALNTLELINPDGPGLMGNGVDTSASGFPPQMALQPIPIGVVVLLEVYRDPHGERVPWFSIPNGFDGPCF